jgi:hypothetical protein
MLPPPGPDVPLGVLHTQPGSINAPSRPPAAEIWGAAYRFSMVGALDEASTRGRFVRGDLPRAAAFLAATYPCLIC